MAAKDNEEAGPSSLSELVPPPPPSSPPGGGGKKRARGTEMDPVEVGFTPTPPKPKPSPHVGKHPRAMKSLDPPTSPA